MGSPGKFRRNLDERDRETIMRYARNYLGYKEEYLKESGQKESSQPSAIRRQ
jgi:carbonic anhydrase/acetyltransferase-like protein (isoleucine patch superfamily)